MLWTKNISVTLLKFLRVAISCTFLSQGKLIMEFKSENLGQCYVLVCHQLMKNVF